jgi:pimeloyl-ACP methyl ester carboxylesterase
MWERQSAAFSAACRFIAYDRLGHGRSQLVSGSPGDAVGDLDALMQHLRIDACHLVGTAAGGMVALDYALSFPQRVRGLVLANSIGGVQDEDYLALHRRLRPAPQFNALPPHVRELGPAYRAADPAGEARWIELERQSRAEHPLPAPQPPRNRITFASLDKLDMPTLLLTGDADLYVPEPVLRLFEKRIRKAEVLVLAGVGHSAYWEQPELFNKAVLEFIQQK